MSKRNSVVCKWKANEKCVTVLHPLQCISIPHRGHPQDTRKPKQKGNRQPRSAIPFCGLVTVATGRRCQLDRKWHALTSIIQHLSVFPLPHSAIFSRAGNTWATPCPWGCSRTLPPAWHGGTTKASRVGTLAAVLTPQTSPRLDLWAPTAPCTCLRVYYYASLATKASFGTTAWNQTEPVSGFALTLGVCNFTQRMLTSSFTHWQRCILTFHQSCMVGSF